jgi:hypothetical protein
VPARSDRSPLLPVQGLRQAPAARQGAAAAPRRAGLRVYAMDANMERSLLGEVCCAGRQALPSVTRGTAEASIVEGNKGACRRLGQGLLTGVGRGPLAGFWCPRPHRRRNRQQLWGECAGQL